SLTFSFHSYVDHRCLRSFPTRRSSDLCFLHEIIKVQHGAAAGFDVNAAFHRLATGKGREIARCATLDQGIERRIALIAPHHAVRSEEHTSELQSRENLVCRLLLEKKKK